jgi:hypothetical protein
VWVGEFSTTNNATYIQSSAAVSQGRWLQSWSLFGKATPRSVGLGFTAAGTSTDGQSSGETQTRYHRADWTDFLQSNDYSLDPNQKFVSEDWSKVTLYLNGVLVWGVEPDGNTPK